MPDPTPPRVILASTSPYRRELLARLGVAFEVLAPEVEESPRPQELPVDRALRLAVAKAQAVAQRHPSALVLGSDQVAAAGSEVLDKPGDADRACAQLATLSGARARFHTACALLGPGGIRLTHVDTTTVHFRTLRAEEIERYVTQDRPFDCAGGFKVEALGVALLESVESEDPTALVGLPLIWVAQALRQAGCAVP
ncbi:MAG: septum formation protein Maf [Gammaproteobacteria bacterium]|nr:septum formation protein Maf [Gammaproteobacteria bacterium]MBV9621140.1 septum formation protein Maf [Gammaproteobacteria bacterium]